MGEEKTRVATALPNPSTPYVVYEDEDIRIVLRSRARWKDGYYDVERRQVDAMGETTWLPGVGVDLVRRNCMSDHPYEAILARVLQSLSRGLV